MTLRGTLPIYRSFSVLLAFALLFSSCAGQSPYRDFKDILDRPLEHGVARVYVFRPKQVLFMGRKTPISVDGKMIGKIGNGEYTSLDLDDGEHIFSTSTWDAGEFSISFAVEGDKTYYLKIAPRQKFFNAFLPGMLLPPVALVAPKLIKNKGMFSLSVTENALFVNEAENLKFIVNQMPSEGRG